MRPRILVVDDSKSLNATYVALLGKFDVDVRSAYTGKETLELIESFAPEIILLDLILPDMSGMDILSHLQETKTNAISIVMAANGSVNYAVEAMRLGAYDFLEKPIDSNRFRITINNTLKNLELNSLVDQINSQNNEAVGDFIGESPAMKEVYNRIRRIKNSKASVFITGESGTGKEVTAMTLHNMNTERKGKFIAINCAAIPKELMESEIFGHVKGAFTGAAADRQGAVSLADGGTLFLDELCEMDLELQSKFLRFLQSSKFNKVGSSRTEEVDVRIVCATNRDPMEEVKAGRFREDLFYRLFVIPIHLPPLRERGRDVILIARKFLKHFSQEENKNFEEFTEEVENLLLKYTWPGNVRQLQNVIHSTVVLNNGKFLTKEMLPKFLDSSYNTDFKDANTQKAAINNDNEVKPASLLKVGSSVNSDETENFDLESPNVNFFASIRSSDSSVSSLSSKVNETEFEKSVLVYKPLDVKEIETIEEVERKYILAVIELCNGSITKAAKHLSINSSTIYRKLDKWQKQGMITKISKYEMS
jgi:two-component system repressor protein LuxO